MNKIKGLIKLLRFELPFAAGVCVVLGQLLALGIFPSLFIIITGFLSVFMISSSILVLNDYFDVETDKINAPHRPIPSNLVTKKEALFLSIILLIGGLLFSLLIGTSAIFIAIILAITGFLYNRHFKKSGLPGNLMVSFSVGMTFIYGGATVGSPFNKIVLFFGLITALIDLGEEIVADAMDVKGDELINSNSIAIKYGQHAALRIGSYIFFFVIFLTALPFIFRWFPAIYLIPIIIIDISIGYFSLKLFKSKSKQGRKYIRWIYLGGTFGLIVFLLMRLIGL